MSLPGPHDPPADAAWLIAMPGGPPLPRLPLLPSTGGVVVGRRRDCGVVLPGHTDTVSRRHARFTCGADHRWRVADLNSRTGTFLNGVQLRPEQELPLRDRDLIRIAPWTFLFSRPPDPVPGVSGPSHLMDVQSVDDAETASVVIRGRRDQRSGGGQSRDPLSAALMAAASVVHGAADESALAAALVRVACHGTGLPNAAVLRANDGDVRRVEVLAACPALGPGEVPRQFSRTLLAAAAAGSVVELSAATGPAPSLSVRHLGIDAAVCAPVMLGDAVWGLLYVDARRSDRPAAVQAGRVAGGPPAVDQPHAASADFCQAIAAMASLALGNLKRMDVEARARLIQTELEATATAQRWILPQGSVACGPFTGVGRSRAGHHVGGDFFDLLPLAQGRLAVAVGDVSGHSVSASVLMAAAQGYLHAALVQHGDPLRAVVDLNRFVCPRTSPDRFVTLWVGLLDPVAMTVSYVDAGHGFAVRLATNGEAHPLSEDGGLPIGVDAAAAYATATTSLRPGEQLLIVTDGLVEQQSPAAAVGGGPQMFGITRVVDTAVAAGRGTAADQVIESLFASVSQFAESQRFTDDVTAVLVRWKTGHG